MSLYFGMSKDKTPRSNVAVLVTEPILWKAILFATNFDSTVRSDLA